MAAAAVVLDPTDVELLSSQERGEDKKTTAARDRVGKALLEFLGDQPLTTDELKKFIRQQATMCKPNTLSTRFSHLRDFIKKHYKMQFTKDQLETILKYIKRKNDKHVPKKAFIFDQGNVRDYLHMVDAKELLEVRNALIFCGGIYTLGRCNEVCGLQVKDVVQDELGMKVTINRSKTDAKHAIQEFIVPWIIQEANLRPFWAAYLDYIPREGALWRRIPDPNQNTLGRSSIEEVTKEAARALELDNPERYTFHGLRGVGATFMANAGCTELELMQAGGWKSPAVAKEYIRRSRASMEKRAALISGTLELTLPPPKRTRVADSSVAALVSTPFVSTAPSPCFTNCVFTNCTFQLK